MQAFIWKPSSISTFNKEKLCALEVLLQSYVYLSDNAYDCDTIFSKCPHTENTRIKKEFISLTSAWPIHILLRRFYMKMRFIWVTAKNPQIFVILDKNASIPSFSCFDETNYKYSSNINIKLILPHSKPQIKK